jgi:hypothetical protein
MEYVGLPVNFDQYKGAWTFYRTNNVAIHCSSILLNSVLAGGICFQTESGSSERDEYIRMHLETFTRAAFDWILCVGVVPIVTRFHPDVKERLPEIPEHHAVRIHVQQTDEGGITYNGLLVKSQLIMSQKPGVFVWAGCDHSPDSSGRIVTPICSLEESQRLVNFWIQTCKTSIKLSCNPLLVTQNRKKRENENDGVIWNVDDDTACAAEQARVDRLEKIANHQHQSRNEYNHKWNELDTSNSLESPVEYYLPEDRDLVRGNSPAPPTNLMEILRWGDERIYAAFCVPPGLFSTTGQKVKNTNTINGVFDAQVRRLRRQIELCLNDSLSLCASQIEYEDPKSTKKRKSNEALKLQAVSCALPEEALHWFRSGFLTYEEVDTSIRSYAGLPKSTLSSNQRIEEAQKYVQTMTVETVDHVRRDRT